MCVLQTLMKSFLIKKCFVLVKMESVENVISLFKAGDEIVKNKSSGTTHIFLQVDKPIYLHGFGIFGRTSNSLSVNQSENRETCNIYLENNSIGLDLYEDEDHFDHDGTPKTYKMMFPGPMLLKENVVYAFGVLCCREEVERFNGTNYKKEIICDGVKFDIVKCVYAQLINSVYFRRCSE